MSESDSGSEMRELSSYGDESGEKEMVNDEFGDESGEQEMSEGEQKDVVDEEFDAGSFVREDGSDDEGEAGIENKRDEVIQQLLSKDDIAMITARITETVKILGNFKELRDPDTARNDYLESLKNDIQASYDYNQELIELIFELFPPAQAVAFVEANEQARPMTIRANTIKTKRKDLAKVLIQRGVSLDPIADWSKVGLKIYESNVPIGATPEYLAGHYILQSPSSFLPVMTLAPQPNENILDMAAAPGGKTSYIAQLMKNTGCLVANDLKKDRLKSLSANLMRLGVTNVVVSNSCGKKMPGMYNKYDRCLLDAPCTGLGVIARDPQIKVQKGKKDVDKLSHLQKELILAAIDCVDAKSKTGGVIVYSTCSVAVEENEWVVDYALNNRYVRCVESGLEVGDQGITKHRMKRFHPSVKHCKRVYPHTHNMDGFFVAKLVKYQNGVKSMEAELQAKEDEVTRANERKVNKAKNAKKRSKKEKRKAMAEEIKNNPEKKKAKEDKKKAFIAKKQEQKEKAKTKGRLEDNLLKKKEEVVEEVKETKPLVGKKRPAGKKVEKVEAKVTSPKKAEKRATRSQSIDTPKSEEVKETKSEKVKERSKSAKKIQAKPEKVEKVEKIERIEKPLEKSKSEKALKGKAPKKKMAKKD